MTAPKFNKGLKRFWVIFTTLGSIGLFTSILLTVSEGVKYRIREEQGLDPIMAPNWVVMTTFAGLAVFAIALVALAVVGAIALGRRQDYESNRSISPNSPPPT